MNMAQGNDWVCLPVPAAMCHLKVTKFTDKRSSLIKMPRLQVLNSPYLLNMRVIHSVTTLILHPVPGIGEGEGGGVNLLVENLTGTYNCASLK